MTSGGDGTVSLWVDGGNRILAVNDAWDGFAAGNDGSEVFRDRVIGTDLLVWIRGDETRMMLAALMQFVRLTGENVRREYRCDSPELRRYMRMTVHRERSGLVRFDHELLRTEPMQPAVRFAVPGAPDAKTVRRCSMCNRVELANAWWNGDEAAREGRLPASNAGSVRYVICPLCRHEQGLGDRVMRSHARSRPLVEGDL